MTENHHPPKVGKTKMPSHLKALVKTAKKLYQDKLAYFCDAHHPPAFIVAAPGRVNLIGEHTDYTGGFCLPVAMELCTVAYGTGVLHTGMGMGPTSIRLRTVSDQQQLEHPDVVEERRLTDLIKPADPNTNPDYKVSWVDYVVGVLMQYMPDLPKEGSHLDVSVAFATAVPLGAGLSSSASLEVATATFVECFLKDLAYSSSNLETADAQATAKERALRCQKGENDWALSPCGIMDQMISSAGIAGHAMLLDCRSFEIVHVPMKGANSTNAAEKYTAPVLLVIDSKVKHSIGGVDSEYAIRRRQCQEALEAIQQVPLYHVLSLRDANLGDAQEALDKGKMDEVLFKRAKHVVTENQRTKECKTALKLGVWDRVGELMQASHNSLRDDYEVSCPELDFLVDAAMAQKEGVYGCRMTGGGFGGCVVALVQPDHVETVQENIKAAYKDKFKLECACYVTHAGAGAQVLAIDMDCKPESDFFKSKKPGREG